MRVYARGNNGTREGFCMKTSPVTPSFYCFNIMLSLRANVRKKLKNSTEGNLHSVRIVVIPSLQEIGSVIFFKIVVHFPFQMPKAFKKNLGSPG